MFAAQTTRVGKNYFSFEIKNLERRGQGGYFLFIIFLINLLDYSYFLYVTFLIITLQLKWTGCTNAKWILKNEKKNEKMKKKLAPNKNSLISFILEEKLILKFMERNKISYYEIGKGLKKFFFLVRIFGDIFRIIIVVDACGICSLK